LMPWALEQEGMESVRSLSGMGRTVEAIDVEAVTHILEKYNVVRRPDPQ